MMHSAFTEEGTILVHALGWALLHSLWQGALISACLWLLLRALSPAQARLRYHLSLAALLLLAGSFATTCLRQWQRLQSVVVYVTETSAETGAQHTHSVTALPPPLATDTLLPWEFGNIERVFPWLVALYSIGLLLMLVRLLMGVVGVHRLRTRQVSLPALEVQQLFDRLSARLQVSTPVKLLCSASAQVPMALGVLKPLVLLPISMTTQLSPAQLEAILIHELVHIRRQDYLINILQTIVELILFFNPFLWWISAGIRREREHCCDDQVLAATLQPLPYATALAAIEATRYASAQLALGAAGSNKHQLFNRIKRLTEMNKTPLSYGRLAAGIVAACAVAGAVIWFTPAFAQEKKDPAPKITKVQKVIVIDDQGNKKEYNSLDELPAATKEKVHQSMKQADEGLDALDEQLAGLDKTMSGLDTTLDGVKLHAIVTNALKSVDWKNIDKTTRIAMAQAGDALVMAGKEMKQVDWDKVNREVASAMKEIDQVDWDAVASAAKEARPGKELKMEIRQQVEEAREQAREAAEEAREAAEDARQEAEDAREPNEPPAPPAIVRLPRPPMPPAPPAPTNYDAMLDEMDRDGLIDRSRGFEIRKNSRELYINGQEQPDEVKVKYRHYFSPGEVRISGDKHRLSITANNTSGSSR